jgi:hypothetical protein
MKRTVGNVGQAAGLPGIDRAGRPKTRSSCATLLLIPLWFSMPLRGDTGQVDIGVSGVLADGVARLVLGGHTVG